MSLSRSESALWSRAQAKETRATGMVDHYKGRGKDEQPICRERRVDLVNRRMRQWFHSRPPLKDNKGRDLLPYMQLDTVKKPKFVQLLTGQVVEYKGP